MHTSSSLKCACILPYPSASFVHDHHYFRVPCVSHARFGCMEECSSTAFPLSRCAALRCVVVSHVCTCNMDECSGIAYIFAFLVMRNSIQTHTAAGSCLEQQSARAPC
ncbi:hypothetical protein K523DRAFT_406141, partial [Schizophyllum commune Tattone D]